MKLMERMKQKRMGNKGFSLVELIIVIAIMAILVGIVGTQVIPYLNRAREQRDVELLSAISTAAVSAYSSHAEDYGNADFTMHLSGTGNTGDAVTLNNQIWEFMSYSDLAGITGAMSSANAGDIDDIEVRFNFTNNTVTVEAMSGGNGVLQAVTSQL